MGRIIRNGIEYGSGNENATNINYDNSLSGLEATTVQEAIDKLSVGGDVDIEVITIVPQVSTQQTITVPNLSQYQELLICLCDSKSTETYFDS